MVYLEDMKHYNAFSPRILVTTAQYSQLCSQVAAQSIERGLQWAT